MNRCSGLTSYSQQGAKSICSTPEVRELANILKAVPLFYFEGKILKQQFKAVLVNEMPFDGHITKLEHKGKDSTVSAKKLVFFLPQGHNLQLRGYGLLPVQTAVFGVGFSEEYP